MPGPDTDVQLVKKILPFQKREITEHHIYTKIAAIIREPGNREVLARIATQELEHYGIWKRYTGQDIAPDKKSIWFYYLVTRIFGMTFSIKLMEGMEQRAQSVDPSFIDLIPEMPQMLANEKAHEQDLIALISEERLKYIGSVVLGLNDALIEFTGTLAGLTFALQNARIIAMAGLITGVAASLSMGASEYLSQRSDESQTDPFRASLYTGFAYILTVALLVLPFLLFSNPYVALMLTLAGAVAVIFLFTFYISVAKELPFWRRFAEMAGICLGISAISFALGLAIRVFLHVDV
jgi:VIT1/CCC1 family predicted Fe2+/Mn2+ transporter